MSLWIQNYSSVITSKDIWTASKDFFFFFAKEISCFLKIHVPPPHTQKKGGGVRKKKKTRLCICLQWKNSSSDDLSNSGQ